VINVSPPESEYVLSWQDFRFVPGIEDWIKLFNAQGYLVVVVTNQRGIAKGLISEEQLKEIHRRMVSELASRGAIIDDVVYCPHEEGTCDCRKPRAGMVTRAVQTWDIDLKHSLLIGDSDRDEELAARCGLTFIKVHAGHILSSTIRNA